MKKSMVVIGAFVLLSFAASEVCFAQMINYNRRNKTGAPANTAPSQPSPVPAAPAAFSAPAAAQEQAMDNVLLEEAVAAVKKNGYYEVDSDLLKEYDENDDGMISKTEAEAIEADIR